MGLFVPGIDSVQRLGRFNCQLSTPDYFRLMNTRIVRGRAFTGEDRAGTPLVAVVSDAMARVLWPGLDPLGQCLRVGTNAAPCTAVIGVAEDAVHQSLTDDQHFMYYLPLDQTQPAGGNQIFVRVRGDVSTAAERVRSVLTAAMPGEGYVSVQPLADLVDTQRRSWQVGATMFVAFGILALLVASVGLYGVISHNVAQRSHELGVRAALGARSADILSLVVGQGLRFARRTVAGSPAGGIGWTGPCPPWMVVTPRSRSDCQLCATIAGSSSPTIHPSVRSPVNGRDQGGSGSRAHN